MTNNVIKTGFKNAVYVLISQSISLLLGIAKTLILPNILSLTSYGYWQVYLLYMSYVGIFALGFNDGIYLRYGKYEYAQLPRNVFRASIRLFILIQFLITIIVFGFLFFEPDTGKQVSMLWAAINIPVSGLTGVLIYVLQVTNQMRKYSFYTILDKIIILAIILCIYLLGVDNILFIIIADTLSRLIVLLLMMITCKEIIFGKGSSIELALKETIDNIRVGIKLMLANFAGMLVLGYGRFLIERTSSVEIYGTYSFSISTMNLVLVIISAIGLVVYPTLNRLEEGSYHNYFIRLNQIILIAVFGSLFLLFPLKAFITSYMPDYISILNYLSKVFAILFVQAKMQILVNPYYKLLRKESMMLNANIIGVLIAVFIVTPLYLITKSVTIVAVGTLLAMILRLYLSELYLKKELGILNNRNIVIEITVLVLFIFFGSLANLYMGMTGYLIIFAMLFIKEFKHIKAFFIYILRR